MLRIVEGFESLRNLLKGVAVIAFTLLLIIQFSKWQGFAFSATRLQTKALFEPLSPDELLQLGAMCNTLEKYECSMRYFEELVIRFPNHKAGFANLGIVLGKSREFKKSKLALTHYFRLGGRAHDAMFWMGKSLANLSQPEKSLNWFYQSLAKTPDRIRVASELIDQLMALGRYEEALSVLASTTKGQPEQDPFWKSKLDGITEYISRVDSETENKRYKIRLPALDGKHHFVPVKVAKDENRYEFFLLDDRVADISVTEDFVLGLPSEVSGKLGKRKMQGSSLVALKIQLPILKVGPWELRDVEVTVCKSCQPRMGAAILDQLELQQMSEENIQFALLSKK